MGRKKTLPLLEKVRIENIGAEGKSLARVDNMVVFVKHAVPGDVVDLQVTRKKGRYMEARVTAYHSYSEQRTEPFCEHFGLSDALRDANATLPGTAARFVFEVIAVAMTVRIRLRLNSSA